jgi:hypothetical protein
VSVPCQPTALLLLVPRLPLQRLVVLPVLQEALLLYRLCLAARPRRLLVQVSLARESLPRSLLPCRPQHLQSRPSQRRLQSD